MNIACENIAPADVTGLWPEIARCWEQVGPPLRPAAEDITFYRRAIDRVPRRSGAALRALILGVTPELYRLPWPAGAEVRAADNTQAMIDTIWPGPKNAAIRAQWQSLPLDASSQDIVLCDGGSLQLAFPEAHVQWVRELHRVIAPTGCFALRLFVPPDEPESAGDVLGDLLEGKVPNLNVLKLRLGMALQEDSRQGVQLARVWDAIHEVVPDLPGLAAWLAWPRDHVLSLNPYRNCAKCYHFITVEDACDLFCAEPDAFHVDTIDVPTYDLGERCPTVVFRRV